MPKTMETTSKIMLNSPQKTMVMALADTNNKNLGNTPAERQRNKNLLQQQSGLCKD
ncbi:hypothetical protein BSPWISOXPB_7394 [uncultured Gammaproteobacteria bacterium]|nr:hypothetical protein BSPWISOXPB_7394 [uncultured Gammaproteobacteria bacterium]